jgi:hypothetical protein
MFKKTKKRNNGLVKSEIEDPEIIQETVVLQSVKSVRKAGLNLNSTTRTVKEEPQHENNGLSKLSYIQQYVEDGDFDTNFIDDAPLVSA